MKKTLTWEEKLAQGIKLNSKDMAELKIQAEKDNDECSFGPNLFGNKLK